MLSNIYILTGPVRSGKTTAIMNWLSLRNDAHGILSPDINGERMFYNICTKEIFPMLAVENEKSVFEVGKYIFSKKNFDKACAIITDALDKEGWIVIDEIGPLELRKEGFAFVLGKIISSNRRSVLLVIRDNILSEVITTFQLDQPTILQIPEMRSLK